MKQQNKTWKPVERATVGKEQGTIVFRLPMPLKERIDDLAWKQRKSTNKFLNDLLEKVLNEPPITY